RIPDLSQEEDIRFFVVEATVNNATDYVDVTNAFEWTIQYETRISPPLTFRYDGKSAFEVLVPYSELHPGRVGSLRLQAVEGDCSNATVSFPITSPFGMEKVDILRIELDEDEPIMMESLIKEGVQTILETEFLQQNFLVRAYPIPNRFLDVHIKVDYNLLSGETGSDSEVGTVGPYQSLPRAPLPGTYIYTITPSKDGEPANLENKFQATLIIQRREQLFALSEEAAPLINQRSATQRESLQAIGQENRSVRNAKSYKLAELYLMTPTDMDENELLQRFEEAGEKLTASHRRASETNQAAYETALTQVVHATLDRLLMRGKLSPSASASIGEVVKRMEKVGISTANVRKSWGAKDLKKSFDKQQVAAVEALLKA
ncbi:MAG: hypothetical protein AAF399_25125, partial [Bacteroidota bacterium]